MEPQIGTVVHYRLSSNDVQTIQRRRKLFEAHDLEMFTGGTEIHSGDLYPAIIVKTYGTVEASLKVLLDGPDELWTTSKTVGESEGQWQYATFSGQGTQQREKASAR